MHSEDDHVVVAVYPAFRRQTDRQETVYPQHIPHPELHLWKHSWAWPCSRNVSPSGTANVYGLI